MPEEYNDCTFSWNSVNLINGIVYGNGGLKLWTKDFIYSMNSHENATGKEAGKHVEFCWDTRYHQLNETFSVTKTNETHWQAFRGGFREGAKLPLNGGKRVHTNMFIEGCNKYNLGLLRRWMSLGMDVKYGLWSILGARDGFLQCQVNNVDITKINNADAMREYVGKFEKYSDEELVEIINRQGEDIYKATSLDVELFSAKQSAVIKKFDVTYNSLT